MKRNASYSFAQFSGSLLSVTCLLLLVGFISCGGSEPLRLPPGSQGTTVILVRHAEKMDQSEDPDLAPEGRERAEVLARLFRETDIRGLFATQYVRTQQTLEPLARELGLNLRIVETSAEEELIQKLAEGYRGRTTLVAGHSDSVPRIMEALGVAEPPSIHESVYDDIFIVTVVGPGEATLLRLKYGAPTVDPTEETKKGPHPRI